MSTQELRVRFGVTHHLPATRSSAALESCCSQDDLAFGHISAYFKSWHRTSSILRRLLHLRRELKRSGILRTAIPSTPSTTTMGAFRASEAEEEPLGILQENQTVDSEATEDITTWRTSVACLAQIMAKPDTRLSSMDSTTLGRCRSPPILQHTRPKSKVQ